MSSEVRHLTTRMQPQIPHVLSLPLAQCSLRCCNSQGRGFDYFLYEEYEPFREDLADRVRASGCLATGPDNQKEWEAAGCVLSHSDELRAFANGIKPLRTNGKFSIYVMKFGQGWEAKKPLAVAMADANGVKLTKGGKEFLIYGEQHGNTKLGEGLALPNTNMVKTPCVASAFPAHALARRDLRATTAPWSWAGRNQRRA